MKRRIALLAAGLMAVGVFIGGASAEDVDLAGSGLYVGTDATVWQESNGLEGLQREATPVEGGDDIPADSKLA